jgi:cytochrome c oxidase subunit 2
MMEFFFSDAANTNEGVQKAFIVILALEALLLVIVMGCMIGFAIFFRRSKNPRPRKVKETLAIEALWTLIPVGVVVIMFWFGWKGYTPFKLGTGSDDVFEVTTIGRMWRWDYLYPNGVEADDGLRVPVNTPVKLIVTSLDVNHSFYIPAFRIKQDAIAGYNTPLYFTPQNTGEYDVYCAEYCGLDHAKMLSKVIVMEQEDFDNWMTEKVTEMEKKNSEDKEAADTEIEQIEEEALPDGGAEPVSTSH